MSPSTPELLRLRLRDVGPAEEAAWGALAARAIEANPFFLPGMLLPAARHLDGGGDAELLVVADGDRWLACVPVVRRPKFSDLLLPGVRTWNHPYVFLWTPLVDRDAVDAVARALVGAPGAWRARAYVALEAIEDGAVARALLAAPAAGATAPFVHRTFSRAALRRRPQDDYVTSHLSGKARRELGRTRRKLAQELGAEPELVDASDDDAAFDRFLALEAGGWKGRAGSALTSDPAHAAFSRDVWADFRGRGAAHLLELRCGDRATASVLCLRAGDALFAVKIGYDESLRQGTPGVLLLADLATWFHEHTDADLLDSCAVPDHALINRLWPDRRDLTTLVLPARGPLGRAAKAFDTRGRARRDDA
ncbi:GNAT family N-acetyltransferase [Patulibacter sp.]|uniref:GNAT family N-acetyltransferase n=1 Tax=Patulibacter sp. TaxID=1912859 RepID=UPI0027221B13|nr:GNAT family N-acetyltransferase [Patulibacter sp.]MDO9407228.1 GNAT family N-acetyltransferase [Patulibacter sp.]